MKEMNMIDHKIADIMNYLILQDIRIQYRNGSKSLTTCNCGNKTSRKNFIDDKTLIKTVSLL